MGEKIRKEKIMTKIVAIQAPTTLTQSKDSLLPELVPVLLLKEDLADDAPFPGVKLVLFGSLTSLVFFLPFPMTTRSLTNCTSSSRVRLSSRK